MARYKSGWIFLESLFKDYRAAALPE